MADSSTAEGLIQGMQPGEATACLTNPPDAQPVFLVRERTAVIRYLGDSGVDARGGFFPMGKVVVTAVAFRVGRHYRKEYGVWLDYHDPVKAGIFPAMSRSEHLSFFFHGDSCRREKTIIAANPLAGFFLKATERIRLMPPWDEEQYKEAVSKILSRYPTPSELWNVLAAPQQAGLQFG
ncbi:MAG: hypothetical protein VB050_14515 [Geobacteraceae bacterium]|nr:hypothetical protein [Geobacteraceae bacterium]